MTSRTDDGPFDPMQTIDNVLDRLDLIIDRCHDRGSRLGFFPAMYRKTTAEVKRGIESGRFEDPDRMERLDVVFAERYLEAFARQERGQPPTAAWDYAFVMSRSMRPTVIQHLLLGMNAHINLDLGISAADVAPGPALDDLKSDFDEINAILVGLARAICSPDNLSGGPERPLLECVRDPDTVRHIIEALVD